MMKAATHTRTSGATVVLSGLFALLGSSGLTIAATIDTAEGGSEPIVRFLYMWGEPGTGTGKFRGLRGIVAYDRKESDRTLVVVADGGSDMLRSYTWNMMFIDKWGSTGTGPGQFREPRGVVVDQDGNLLVVDAYNNRVQKTAIGTKSFLERPGEPILAFGRRGDGDGEFHTPSGVAVNSANEILVVDTENHRVQRFDAQGKFLSSMGSLGSGREQFNRPTHIAVDANGRILVSDSGNHRIQVFDAEGSHVRSIGKLGTAIGEFAEPKGIAVDSDGHIWVVDKRNHRLQKFLPDGTPAGAQGRQGPGRGEFSFPEDVTVDSSGRIYVADGMNGRIQVFSRL